MEVFDEEAVFDNEILPLLRQIVAICREHKIPMLTSFAYRYREVTGVGLCSTLLNKFKGRHSSALQTLGDVIWSAEDYQKSLNKQEKEDGKI